MLGWKSCHCRLTAGSSESLIGKTFSITGTMTSTAQGSSDLEEDEDFPRQGRKGTGYDLFPKSRQVQSVPMITLTAENYEFAKQRYGRSSREQAETEGNESGSGKRGLQHFR